MALFDILDGPPEWAGTRFAARRRTWPTRSAYAIRAGGAPRPDPDRAPEAQGWQELAEGDFLLPWLLHITMYERCGRPCCAPFRDPKPSS